MKHSKSFLTFVLFFIITTSQGQELATAKDSLVHFISQKIKGVKIKEIETAKPYSVKLELMVPQLLNHEDRKSDTLWQLVYVSHRSFDAPTVIVTEGYSAEYAEPANYNEELCKILKSNLIFVEHRFFGKSAPAKMDWQYLTIKQAADDHHAIIQYFKPIYPQKWVATGTSKGGSTALYLKAFFPEDVDAVVAYVAPITNAQEDMRPINYIINQAGSEEERKIIYNYQLLMLKKMNKILPLFNTYAEQNKLTFPMGNQTTLEYLILEYPFSHWQWGISISKVPTKKDTEQKMLEYLIRIVDPSGFSDNGGVSSKIYYYQAYAEVGYYNYNAYLPIFTKYLKKATYSNNTLIPVGSNPIYNPKSHQEIVELLNKNGKHIMQIHGALDPWYQAAWNPNKAELPLFVLPNGSHGVRIAYFDTETKTKIYDQLELWLGIKVRRL